ncbi:hypothetical protein BBBOND_0211050 [Babesia bigemina]|uniref:Uncharacterized protein n=1 Tax=Babesia bigemina TaxID=5866 RepID=A0A061D5W9_BABBI|nr:hypothetical protein BBBOND_0211050 [Babesia bigemina]CDR95958.1 hypothetical protein BBBOND_0211050 [Babesia bigemina]|eukprot:XP_012768144.1 hypothetical protein BBBOND_0211050 [Babesia bigemina]
MLSDRVWWRGPNTLAPEEAQTMRTHHTAATGKPRAEMNPLALLEQQCLQTGKDKEYRPAEGDNAGDDSPVEAQAPDSNCAEKPQVEVLAHFTYPVREQHTPSDDERRGRWEQAPVHTPLGKRERRARSRSRSRSRSREQCRHRPRERREKREERTHRTEDSSANDNVGKAAAGSDPLPQTASMHQMSPIDRMLLRREQLLMRQSAKFLNEVKRQQDAG